MNNDKFIISGGGTGGHIYPAIAIANAIKEKLPNAEILFIGALGKMEMEKVPQAGYKIIGLPIQGIQRKLTLSNLLFPIKLIKSISLARAIIKEFKPTVCIGVGGYASGPLIYAASILKIPILIQEQNSYAGLTNKWLAKKAMKFCVAYNDMDKFFPKEKIVFTGNPVRRDIVLSYKKKEIGIEFFKLDPQKKTVLILGGSLGSKTINESIEEGLDKLISEGLQVIWQTGKNYYSVIKDRFILKEENLNMKIFPFIAEMDLAYAVADIIISRAGALSVSEICIVSKPAIFIPSPNVAEDHQTKNAKALINENAALLVTDADSKSELINKILSLSKDEKLQKQLADNIEKLARPEAAQQIADEIIYLIKKLKNP